MLVLHADGSSSNKINKVVVPTTELRTDDLLNILEHTNMQIYNLTAISQLKSLIKHFNLPRKF